MLNNKSYFQKLFTVDNTVFFIISGVVFRLIYLFFLSPYFLNGGEWVTLKGDSYGYLQFAENLYSEGSYYVTRNGKIEHSWRMPGLTPFYLMFRSVVSQQYAIYSLIIFQTVISGIAIYYLSKIAYLLTSSKLSFYLTFTLFTFSTHLPKCNNLLLNESLACSFLIFGAYHFMIFLNDATRRNIFISGCFLGWMSFLRPFTILILPFIAILTIIHAKKSIVNVIIFFSFPLLAISAWTIRNSSYSKEMIFLESSGNWLKDYPKSFVSVYDIVKGTGGDLLEWEQNSDVNWYFSDKFLNSNFGITRSPDEILPDILFNEELTLELLKKGQYHFSAVLDSANILSKKEINLHDTQAIEIFEKFSTHLKTNHFFTYHITSRIRYLIRFLNQNIGVSVRPLKYPFNVIFTFFDSFLNFICFSVGFSAFLIGFIINFKNLRYWLIYGLAAYALLLFPFVLKTSEERYALISFPFLILSFSTLFNHKIFSKTFTKVSLSIIAITSIIVAFYTTVNFIIW